MSTTYLETLQPFESFSSTTFPLGQSVGFIGTSTGHCLQRSRCFMQREAPDIFTWFFGQLSLGSKTWERKNWLHYSRFSFLCKAKSRCKGYIGELWPPYVKAVANVFLNCFRSATSKQKLKTSAFWVVGENAFEGGWCFSLLQLRKSLVLFLLVLSPSPLSPSLKRPKK